jgi:hypothetical protein
MPVVEERVTITLSLPKPVAERVAELAKDKNVSMEGELETLVETGLRSEMTLAERFDRLSERYRARLAREGKANRTYDEMMEELARVREEIANELYPD